MGSADVRAYSRNKRGIAGNLVWINFDRHALLNLFQRARGTFVADMDEIRPQFTDVSDGSMVFQSSIVRDLGPSISSTIDQLDALTVTNVGYDKELAPYWYSDQILPFDITLTGANEYGAMCAAKILGCELLNEGTGISIDDAVSEQSATFVARAIEPKSTVPSPFLPRDFRPLPSFGAIENNYRSNRVDPNIYRYMNHLHHILCWPDCRITNPRLPEGTHGFQNCATRLEPGAENCATGHGSCVGPYASPALPGGRSPSGRNDESRWNP